MTFTDIVLAHARKYPEMQAQDYVKLAYQHALGCGHLVKDEKTCLDRIRAERNGIQTNVRTEPIGNGLVRLYLDGGDFPVSDDAVKNMFMHTANTFTPAENALENALDVLLSLSEKNLIGVNHADMTAFITSYKSQGMPLVSHTNAYRNAYHPAYRVVSEAFAGILSCLSALEKVKREKKNPVIAIDGMCASGKTTLARLLSVCLNAPVFHMDDFFLPPAKRTPERLSEPGGNVDYERFKEEVLTNIKIGKPFSFRPFDCGKMDLSDPVQSAPGEITIVEGAYACHPTLIDDYDFIILMTVDSALQKERILKRNGAKMLERFVHEWIPMEMNYLEHFKISEKADLIIKA